MRTNARCFARHRSRSGAMLYSMVIANCLIVGLLGLAALTVVRVERKAAQRWAEMGAAQTVAWAGVELAVRELVQNANWRTSYVHGVETTSRSFGGGAVSWRLLDTTDANLADDPTDGVEVHGIGRVGDAIWVHSVQFQFREISPLDHPLHAHGTMTLNSGDQLTVSTGAVSTNSVFDLDGTLIGAAECLSKTGSGAASGTITEDAPVKGLPDSGVFASYTALATTLPYIGDLYQVVLTPGVNTYGGALNTDGVYLINTGGAEIDIRGSRIQGTLVIQGNCQIDDSALVHSHRADYPVLIISGNLRITTDSQTASLSEANWGVNFNPTGAAYSGVTDTDETDVYPNEVQGLVHVKGNLTLDQTSRIRGIIICEGQATIDGGNNELIYDSAIAASPPVGYNIVDYLLTSQAATAHRAAAP